MEDTLREDQAAEYVNEQYQEDLKESKESCPRCKNVLYTGFTSSSRPDDYVTFLKCTTCGYYEED